MTETISQETAAHLIKQMMASGGWIVMVQAWNLEREKIIASGKKGRSEEKKIHMWAELDGFDKAVLMAERIVKTNQFLNQVTENENEP